jgi:radical SAM family RiPP maturation amino acid epimerase
VSKTPPSAPTSAAEAFRAVDAGRSAHELYLIAHIKRFQELWIGDPAFRRGVVEDPARTASSTGLDVEPEDLLPFYHEDYAEVEELEVEKWPLVKLWADRASELAQIHDLYRSQASPADSSAGFDVWRRRQIARNRSELGPSASRSVTYPVIAYELSKGCSIGCWFCGFSAGELESYLPYTSENASLWRDVLEAARALFGTAVMSGFCYWATEPMDNPDYVRFLEDHYEIAGSVPQTTTAAPLRDIALTREVLALHEKHRCDFDRFSILNLKTMRGVHREFSPDELLHVQLVMQQRGALGVKASAGRARARYMAAGRAVGISEDAGTVACVVGFLVNMEDRSVRLISPCKPCDQHPDGYITYTARTFTSGQDFHDVCSELIEDYMPESLQGDDRLAFRSDLEYEEFVDGFRVKTAVAAHTLSGQPYLRDLGRLIETGQESIGSIRDRLLQQAADYFAVNRTLQDLFDAGLLHDPLAIPDREAIGTPARSASH